MRKVIIVFFILVFGEVVGFGQSWLWVSQADSTSASNCDISAMAADSLSNIYAAGSYVWTVQFNTNVVINTTIGSVFLVKYNSSGSPIWAKAPYSSSAQASILSVISENNKNVYVAGWYVGSLIFPSDTLHGSSMGNSFVAKYDSSGNVEWATDPQKSSNASSACFASVCDVGGNIYIAGYFNDTITFGTTKLISSGTHLSVYIAKYTSSGKNVWAKEVLSKKGFQGGPLSLNIDATPNLYLSGAFEDTIIFGTHSYTNGGPGNMYIIKYDSAGNIIRSNEATIAGYVVDGEPNGIHSSTDNIGNSYVSGTFIGTIKLGSNTLNSNHNSIFIAKFDSSLDVKWVFNTKQPLSSKWNSNSTFSICTDKFYNFYISGAFNDTITFNNMTLRDSIGSLDPGFLLKFDSAGNGICGTFIRNDNDDYSPVAADPTGDNVYFSGDVEHYNYCTFGKDTVKGDDTFEYFFLAKWTCASTESINPIEPSTLSISLFPNPSPGKFTIAVGHPELVSGSQTIVEIYNVLGESVYVGILKQVQGDNSINISNQPNGIYLYRVLSEEGNLLGEGKVIIQK